MPLEHVYTRARKTIDIGTASYGTVYRSEGIDGVLLSELEKKCVYPDCTLNEQMGYPECRIAYFLEGSGGMVVGSGVYVNLDFAQSRSTFLFHNLYFNDAETERELKSHTMHYLSGINFIKEYHGEDFDKDFPMKQSPIWREINPRIVLKRWSQTALSKLLFALLNCHKKHCAVFLAFSPSLYVDEQSQSTDLTQQLLSLFTLLLYALPHDIRMKTGYSTHAEEPVRVKNYKLITVPSDRLDLDAAKANGDYAFIFNDYQSYESTVTDNEIDNCDMMLRDMLNREEAERDADKKLFLAQLTKRGKFKEDCDTLKLLQLYEFCMGNSQSDSLTDGMSVQEVHTPHASISSENLDACSEATKVVQPEVLSTEALSNEETATKSFPLRRRYMLGFLVTPLLLTAMLLTNEKYSYLSWFLNERSYSVTLFIMGLIGVLLVDSEALPSRMCSFSDRKAGTKMLIYIGSCFLFIPAVALMSWVLYPWLTEQMSVIYRSGNHGLVAVLLIETLSLALLLQLCKLGE